MRVHPQRVRSRFTQRQHCGVQSIRDGLKVIGNRSALVSRVSTADLCPNIVWTAFTLAPALIDNEAAV